VFALFEIGNISSNMLTRGHAPLPFCPCPLALLPNNTIQSFACTMTKIMFFTKKNQTFLLF
jgi:hypothetical protein